MTKSEFQELQIRAASCGTTLKDFLRAEGVAYSTYNYWCKKSKAEAEPMRIAPISIRTEFHTSSAPASMAGVDLPGVTLETEGIHYSERTLTGQAVTYAYTRWENMMRVLEDGRLKLDNNLAENEIRPITLGRKNYLFCGNHESAENMCVIQSLLATCRNHELTGLKDQVRDIFLVGCYTCQRVSDYNNIQSEDFTTTAKGTPIIRLVQQKTRNEVKIPIMNPNLEAICKKYEYNLHSVVDQILNHYIKEILKDLCESVPTLAVKVPTKLTMKQKEKEKAGELTVGRNDKGEVMMPRYDCVTTHTARRSGITNTYLSHKFTIVQMMHVSGHKTQKTFMDYIKLSSDEIADEIDAIVNGAKEEVF